ncbi:MAG: hypothetical protein P4L67_03995 [Candidatus Pacebacteria bacterium]|nr:hypothetical protein [Candidatus Paceibacterota bacterium]
MNSWERGGYSPESQSEAERRISSERQLLEGRSGKKRGVAKVLLLASVLSVGGFWAGNEFNQHKNVPDREATHLTETGDSPKATQKHSHEQQHVGIVEQAAAQQGEQEVKHSAEARENIDASGAWVDSIVAKAESERGELQSADDLEAYARTIASDLRSQIEFPTEGIVHKDTVYGVEISARVYNHDDGKHIEEAIHRVEGLIQSADHQFGSNVYQRYSGVFEDMSQKVHRDAGSSYSREKDRETIQKAEQTINEYNQQ